MPCPHARKRLPRPRARIVFPRAGHRGAPVELFATGQAEFFTPFGFVVMTELCGSGALLAHELRVRWNKSWPTLLTLGAAFAVIEEGLMVRSFFDPNWPEIASLGSSGRALLE